MLEKRSEGFTLRSIASYLNELGLRTLSGKHCYASTVRKAMLVNCDHLPDRPAPAPAPAEILAIMQQMRSEGATLRAIAARLNFMELRTPKGKHWYASTVRAAMLFFHSCTELCTEPVP